MCFKQIRNWKFANVKQPANLWWPRARADVSAASRSCPPGPNSVPGYNVCFASKQLSAALWMITQTNLSITCFGLKCRFCGTRNLTGDTLVQRAAEARTGRVRCKAPYVLRWCTGATVCGEPGCLVPCATVVCVVLVCALVSVVCAWWCVRRCASVWRRNGRHLPLDWDLEDSQDWGLGIK